MSILRAKIRSLLLPERKLAQSKILVFLKEFELSVDFMPGLFEFQIFGRKNEGNVSRNLFLAL